MNNRYLFIGLMVLLGIFLSFLAGNWISEENFTNLAGVFLLAAFVIYAVNFSKYWVVISMLPMFLMFDINPIGFSIGPKEIILFIIIIFVATHMWIKGFFSQSNRSSSFSLFTIIFSINLFYLGIHTYYNLGNPFMNELLSWKNILKDIISINIGFIIIYTVVNTTNHSLIPKNLYLPAAYLILLGTIVNLAIRAYGAIVLGHFGQIHDTVDENSGASVLYIPILNLTDNEYALRGLSVICFLFGLMMKLSKSAIVKSDWRKILSFIMMFVGFIASVFSGGRSVVFMMVFLGVVFLWVRKKIFPVLLILFMGFCLLIGAKVLYEISPESVPLQIQRSMAIIPFMHMADAEASIDSSSDWRFELFRRSLLDWEQSWRTLVFGRSVYAFTEDDKTMIESGTQEGEWIVNVRRGTTHNVLTDLLVPYGIVGLVFYLLCYLTFLNSFWKLRRQYIHTPEMNDYTLLCILLIVPAFLSSFIGGGYLSPENALLTSVAIAYSNKYLNSGDVNTANA